MFLLARLVGNQQYRWNRSYFWYNSFAEYTVFWGRSRKGLRSRDTCWRKTGSVFRRLSGRTELVQWLWLLACSPIRFYCRVRRLLSQINHIRRFSLLSWFFLIDKYERVTYTPSRRDLFIRPLLLVCGVINKSYQADTCMMYGLFICNISVNVFPIPSKMNGRHRCANRGWQINSRIC